MKFRNKEQLAIFNPVPEKFCSIIIVPKKSKKFLIHYEMFYLNKTLYM